LGNHLRLRLEAVALPSGEIDLINGLHRWVVARDLGIEVVPVSMMLEAEPTGDLESGLFSGPGWC
jgi:hypothetical protein